METNFIALAIPVFFATIGVEMLVLKKQKKIAYRFNDAVTDLGCGIGQQIVGIGLKVFLVALFLFVARFAPFKLQASSVWTWVIAYLGVDFLYYWWHRASHRVNFLWAAHVVHHQSQDYNLAVALRQAWFTSVTSTVFYLPLALLGIPATVFIAVHSLNTLYQFWIHTEAVGRMGVLEAVINTPSHHRVHHAINPAYIDKNYAASLIIWDKMFGTFKEEAEPCVYGTVKPFNSWNSVWANFEYFSYMFTESRGVPLRDKFLIWFKPPEWRTGGRGNHVIPPVTRSAFQKFATPVSRGVVYYVFVNFVVVTVATTALLFRADRLPPLIVAGGGGLILMALLGWGGLFENKRWAKVFEGLRLGLTAVFLLYFSSALLHS